jgi:hypothetical protein
MATRKANLTVVDTTPDPAPVHIIVTDLQTLLLQQKELAEQIKAAKAAIPPRDRLAEVIHKQTTAYDQYIPRLLANRIQARVNAGQDRVEAADQVMAFFRNLADERIDREEMDEQDARAQEIQEEVAQ